MRVGQTGGKKKAERFATSCGTILVTPSDPKPNAKSQVQQPQSENLGGVGHKTDSVKETARSSNKSSASADTAPVRSFTSIVTNNVMHNRVDPLEQKVRADSWFVRSSSAAIRHQKANRQPFRETGSRFSTASGRHCGLEAGFDANQVSSTQGGQECLDCSWPSLALSLGACCLWGIVLIGHAWIQLGLLMLWGCLFVLAISLWKMSKFGMRDSRKVKRRKKQVRAVAWHFAKVSLCILPFQGDLFCDFCWLCCQFVFFVPSAAVNCLFSFSMGENFLIHKLKRVQDNY